MSTSTQVAPTYHLVLRSENRKTGPIPVSMSNSGTCSPDCGMRDECYAKGGKVALHWGKVDSGLWGMPWGMYCDAVATLPMHQLWRANVAGDLPRRGRRIRVPMLRQLVDANRGKRGFTYCHHPDIPWNIAAIREANAGGFTINLSADSPEHADRLARHGLPVVTVIPSTVHANLRTPAGRLIVVCPATREGSYVTCATCGLCQRNEPTRPIVGFPAHGSRAKRIDIKLLTQRSKA